MRRPTAHRGENPYRRRPEPPLRQPPDELTGELPANAGVADDERIVVITREKNLLRDKDDIAGL
jgi:hypothetical protein